MVGLPELCRFDTVRIVSKGAVVNRTHYPHDYLHQDRSYAESQKDIAGGLLLGAVTLIALMTLIVLGLV
jgi:hypothetical protein